MEETVSELDSLRPLRFNHEFQLTYHELVENTSSRIMKEDNMTFNG